MVEIPIVVVVIGIELRLTWGDIPFIIREIRDEESRVEAMHYQCLIVDDEKPLAESTAEYFTLFDVQTAAVFDAASALAFLKEHSVDVILLDINLQESSGFDLCKILRKETQVPILFISARQSDDDIVLALNIGGDDYIKKPYSLSVLLAKVKAVLKRHGKKSQSLYEQGHLRVDLDSGKVYIHGEVIKLKAQEYKLLAYLIQHANRTITKEELFEHVWQNQITSDGTLNVHIRHLREKIEEDPNQPVYIKTIWGIGYEFCGEKR